MNDFKLPKRYIILHIIFYLSCILSTVCFAINYYYGIWSFCEYGFKLFIGYIINPVGLIMLSAGIRLFDAKDNVIYNFQYKENSWIWFIVLFLIDTIFYFVSALLMIKYTGA